MFELNSIITIWHKFMVGTTKNNQDKTYKNTLSVLHFEGS